MQPPATPRLAHLGCAIPRKGHTININVIKRDGSRQPYDADRINASALRAAQGLPDALSLAMRVTSKLRLVLNDGMTTADLDEATISEAIGETASNPDFDIIATRLRLKVLYKQVLGSDQGVQEATVAAWPAYVREGIAAGRLDPRMERIDADALAAVIDTERDSLFRFIGLTTMRSRYLQSDGAGHLLETPQMCWARVACGLALEDEDPTAAAIRFYQANSKLEFMPAGSIIVNAGTNHPQLSNCFVIDVEDEIDHIYEVGHKIARISKGTGGIGISVTKMRSSGSPVKSNDTFSTGPIPFIHTYDSTLRAISRNGKKFGAMAIYMEPWHLDYEEFLDLREATGADPYRRIRTANTATWIPDEFMRRVENEDEWYMFDPAETPDLTELYGQEFSAAYQGYIAAAKAGKMTRFERVSARELWSKMLVKLQTTGHPWITFKDAANTRALNNNTGTIHSSNLCVEVYLPQDRNNISVCNLTSINLSNHLVDGNWDWDGLNASVHTAVRLLDNLVDTTRSGVKETEHSNDQNRAVGLGFMGFTDVLERLGIAYDSEAAADLSGKITEFISWHAIDASCDLAIERGSYPNFDGSGWSKGMVPFDSLAVLDADRGEQIKVKRDQLLDWDHLRARVVKGIRNATLMAIAPTANIGNVAGTTLGVDPQFGQMFARDTASGKFLEVNRNLVTALRERGMWDALKGAILAARGDLTQVDGIPADIASVYQTSFNISPTAFINVAARAQVYVDQGISRNMYHSRRDLESISAVYFEAWKSGLKSTYYAHFKPRQNAEQSTTSVNKSSAATSGGAAPARRGFGGARKAAPAPVAAAAPLVVLPEPVADACPVDPQERLECDSCQ